MLHADKYIFLVNESNNGMHCTINVFKVKLIFTVHLYLDGVFKYHLANDHRERKDEER